MTAPRVSIGLPVFNGERYLEAAIASLLQQDFEDFELILADNCSTDRTLEICQDAASRDARVSVHRSDQNRGAAWNYNRVVALARGRYFKWAAHDDVHDPRFLSRCVAVLDQLPTVSLCYTRAVDIDENDTVVLTHDLPQHATAAWPAARVASVILDPTPCMESFGLTRIELLTQTSLIGAYTASDRTLLLELAMLGTFYEVPEILFSRRQHAERSVHAYGSSRQRNAWFDPAWNGRRSAPQCRLLREYVRAALHSPVSSSDRVLTMAPIARWAFRSRRALVREVMSYMSQRGVVRARDTGAVQATGKGDR